MSHEATEPTRRWRPVRSYVLREGRLTPAQRRALDGLWPRYGLERPGDGDRLDFAAAFGRAAPVWLEIGFGNGDALRQVAASHPELNCVGIEVHRPGIGHLLRRLADDGLDNVRVIRDDAAEILRDHVADAALARVLVLFPDPWPKKRHHKRRLVQPAFVAEIARVLAPHGIVHLATDWDDYAEHMRAVLDAEPALARTTGARTDYRPRTRFEARGERRGHAVHDLVYRRVRDPAAGHVA
ncbi:MAG: tRNA (guanosine(46)-N7)-methyltransferase TrmB [Halofilum sp. (in: g-proteobacteria)]|nr:tRNA (guanosine(46)-N7)-methyltransferase TrmB [Halofilum sp. (in: g-proteobacteria)]